MTSQQAVTVNGRTLTSEELAKLAIAIAMEKKAYAPTLIDLRDQDAFTEFFGIVTASNHRQVAAITEDIKLFFKNKLGVLPVTIDGVDSSTWVLMDYGHFFIHVFVEETRQRYQLEQLWSKGLFLELSEKELDGLMAEVKELINSAQ